ncbi:MAG: DHA2 family efflux MFS transporter permease subunit [Capsulimonadaceae bacterium]|nr:DHA2 family efflux MFS transporter permease subunit [Capsulimonadaceae bacterium]
MAEDNGKQTDQTTGGDVLPDVARHRWWILVGLVLAAALEILDTTVVNVALPQMAGNLSASTDEIAWVSTGYILSNIVVLPMTAFLSSHFGRKKYLIASLIIFNVARFMCGLSHSLGEIVFWRLVQGAGGAALISTAQSTIVEIFPRNQTAMVQAIFSLGLVVTPTLGPALGGYITDNYSWQTIFFIHIPIGLACLLLVGMYLQDSVHQTRAATIDVAGILLLASGMGSLQYVLEEGERYGWFEDVWISRLTVIAVVSLVAFVIWELSRRNTHPVLDLRVLKDRGLAAAVIIAGALGFGLYGGVFIYPLFAQTVLGFTPTATGILLIPGGLATALGSLICGRVLAKGADPRHLITIGMVIYIVSMWMLGHLTPQSGEMDAQAGLLVRGLGLGFMFVPMSVAAFAGLKGAAIAQGSALFNLMRQMGGSFGIAILTTYVVDQTHYHRSNLVGALYSGRIEYLQRITGLTAHMMRGGYTLPMARSAAFGTMNRLIQAQSATMAYNDGFLLLGIIFVVALPVIFLLRRPQRAPVPAR